jgi:tetratricopeptide (TPR) repeat protein
VFEKGQYELALELFQKALKPLSPMGAPQYYNAVCLLKTGRLREAIAELERMTWWTFISTDNLNFNFLPLAGHWSVTSVKAHYWLGVAYEQQGNKVKAKEEYGKFLDIWKDADFNSPEIADAKARLAKLNASSKSSS